jgi:membrane carboxypeptidase/penicillin-binding protein PbpC
LRPDRKFHRYKGWHFGIKTGTTNDNKDGLMMSFSTQYAAGVWVGYHNRTVEMTGSMESMTQPILQGWMDGAHDPLKPVGWTKPSDVQTLPAYIIRNHFSTQHEVTPSPAQDLFPSWYKQSNKGGGSKTIDKVSGKIATSCTPDAAKEDQNNANDNQFSADIFVGTNSSNTSSNDDVHNCDDVKPQVTLTAPDNCNGSCTITASVTQGTHPLSSDKFAGAVDLYVNGQKVQSQAVSTSPSTVSFTYTPTSAGTASIEVRVTDSVLYSGSDSKTIATSTQTTGTTGGTGNNH